MRRRHGEKGNITGLAALLVFGVFAVCILLVLLTGAGAYRDLTQRDERAYEGRTAAQYITTRVRQGDRAGGIAVERFGGVDALVIREEYDGVGFCTRVYCHDGMIRELFTLDEDGFLPEDGEQILPAGGLELELNGQLLQVTLTDEDGQVQVLTLYLRSGEGAVP